MFMTNCFKENTDEIDERMKAVFAEIREYILDLLPPPDADVDTETVYYFNDPEHDRKDETQCPENGAAS